MFGVPGCGKISISLCVLRDWSRAAAVVISGNCLKYHIYRNKHSVLVFLQQEAALPGGVCAVAIRSDLSTGGM